MQDKFSENMSKKKKIIHSAWFWILMVMVMIGILSSIMLPIGIDYGIVRYFKDQGADQVALEDVDFNPFIGRMTLTNLSVIIGAQTVLKIPQATLKIRWRPLISKRLVLTGIIINDTEITVHAFEDGKWQVGGIKLPGKKETSEPAAWDFGLQQVAVKNSMIKFISSQLSSDLKIEQAQISKLNSWLPERSAHLEFEGQLNDGNLQLQLEVSPFGKDILASGQVKLKGLTLTPFAQLLKPQINTLKGRLEANLNIETRQTADSGFSHRQKGLLKLSQIHTQIEDTEFSNESLAWDGAVQVDIPKSGESLKISTDGRLNGSKLAMTVKNDNIRIQHNDLDWNGRIDYAQDTTNKDIKADGQMRLASVKMESPEVNLSEEELTWKGALQFSAIANTRGQRVMADGALNGSHLLLDLLNRKLKLEHQGLSWKGRLDTGETSDLKSLKADADLILKDIAIHHSETSQGLLKSNRLDLQTIKVEGLDEAKISDIAVKGLELFAAPKAEGSPSAAPSVLQLQSVNFENVHLSKQKDLAIDTINLQEVKAFVHRDPQGKWSPVERWNAMGRDVFAADQTKQAASDTRAKKKTENFGFRIGKVEITGDSLLRFQDESVSPAFSIDLRLLEARLADLDSRQPEKPATVKLLISGAKQARLLLDGSVQPFAERLNLDWVGKIESLELPPLSPYVIQSTGYRFISGEMQADIPIKIIQNQLEGKIDLILYNPTIERVKEEKLPEEKQGKIQLNMSLDSALKLLRDKQNNVKLNIPISGDISNPEFSVADAVNKVLAKTLQSSALSYLKYMLGPYGIGISVAQLALEQAAKIRLNPITFAPGSFELDEAASDYLKRVAAILKEHPTVQVVVCGVATESDRGALGAGPSTAAETQPTTQKGKNADKDKATAQKEPAAPAAGEAALLELAKNRAKRIEDQLVKLHGIAAKRIIACKPQIDRSAEAKPRADLEI